MSVVMCFCFGSFHSSYLNFFVVTLFLLNTHDTNSLTLHKPVFVVLCVRYVYFDSLFSRLVGGLYFLPCCLWSGHTSSILC
jgi:hypothetical protein